MWELLQYDFMRRALAAGLALSVVAPAIGTFLVVKRYSLLADTLSHVSLLGVVAGVFFGMPPLFGAIGVSLLASMAIEKMRQTRKIFGESVLALFLSGSLAVTLIFLGLARGLDISVLAYLFGSLTTVSSTDVAIIVVVSLILCLVTARWYRQFFAAVYDEEWALASGLPVRRINLLLMIMAGVTAALGIQVVGALLVGALMVIPVMTAMLFSASFWKTIFTAVILSVASVMAGLVLSFYLDVPSGATIVTVNLIFFGAGLLLTRK